MIILGLDISMTATGWAIAELKGDKLNLLRCGVIATKKSKEKVATTSIPFGGRVRSMWSLERCSLRN